MNYVVAVLLYHAGEVGAFWLLYTLMEEFKLKEVMQMGMVGLQIHQ